jgi:agmatine deiminase
MSINGQNKRTHAVRFGFNGWAKYPDHDLDAAVPEQISPDPWTCP